MPRQHFQTTPEIKTVTPDSRPQQFNWSDSWSAEPHPGRADEKNGPKMLNFFIENSLLNHFMHFQLQNNAPICLQIPSKVKVMLGKSCCFLPVVLKHPMSSLYFFSLSPKP
jgi:hypothetical protein